VSQKYRVRKNRLWGATILIILILLTADIFAVYTFGLFDTKHPSMDTGKWYYRLQKEDHLSEGTEDWLEVHKIGNSIKSKENSILYYKTQLPDSSIPDPCILLQTNDQVFRIFLDGKVIYSFGNFDAFDFKHSPGAPLHFITLPQNYQNRELVIEMKAIDKERLGLIRAIEVDSRSNHIMRLLRSGMGPLVLGFLDIIIGTACLLIGIVRRLGRQALISLGNSFVVMGIWSISENNLTQLFYLKPILWYYIAVVSFYLIPISIYKFLKDISSTDKRILSMMIRFHLLLFAASMLLDILGVLPIINILILHYAFLTVCYVLCVLISTKSYMRGNSTALIYTVGFLVLGGFGVHDILGWYFAVIPWRSNLAPWGMFIFQLGLLFTLIVYMQRVQDRFVVYRERLKRKNFKLKEKDKKIDQVMEYEKIRTDFFANISHELRTPLNIISSTVQLIKMYGEKGIIASSEKNFDKYLNMISQNCLRLIKLVNNMIDITKIDSGFYLIELRKINIVALVENITISIEEYAKNKGIQLLFDTDTEEEIVSCDADAIERIILNLLSNAIKFTKQGDSVKVRVKSHPDKVVIEVEDTGIGIPEDKLEKIFERFVQVDKTFTRQHEGSGIGLTLVKNLVELHEGTIHAQSCLHKGSLFVIALPRAMMDESDVIEEVTEDSKKDKVSIEFSDI
jgi:signal transduction histidine kinase